jgi:hypothetical protein
MADFCWLDFCVCGVIWGACRKLKRGSSLKASFLSARSPPPLHYLIVHCCREYSWIEEYIASKGKNRANFGVMGIGIHMPLLLAVMPGLVAFAFYKAKHKGICIPLNVQNVCMNHIFGSRNEIPLEGQKILAKMNSLPSSFKKSSRIFLYMSKPIFFFPIMFV